MDSPDDETLSQQPLSMHRVNRSSHSRYDRHEEDFDLPRWVREELGAMSDGSEVLASHSRLPQFPRHQSPGLLHEYPALPHEYPALATAVNHRPHAHAQVLLSLHALTQVALLVPVSVIMCVCVSVCHSPLCMCVCVYLSVSMRVTVCGVCIDTYV